jgi:hypothetical protein
MHPLSKYSSKKEIPNEGNKNDKTTRRSNDIAKQSNKAMTP